MRTAIFLLAVLCVPVCAAAQEAQPTPAPANPTFMDREYDGRLHVNAIPYVWLPSVKSDVQYTVPAAERRGKRIINSTVNVGPSQYLSSLNSAAMFAFNARKGDVSVLGDLVYLNASSSATIATTFSGLGGRVQFPATFDTSARLTAALWDLAAAISIGHGHNADLNFLVGARDFPLTVALGYTVTAGKGVSISGSGSQSVRVSDGDVILGLEGKAYYGDSHWMTPYYIDIGAGTGNNSWQAYTGVGYTFDHGQSILALWRSLNYDHLPPDSPVRKLTLGGQLLGYSFGL